MGDLVERQQLGFVFCCSVWDFPYWRWSLHRIFDSELNYHFQGRTLIGHGLIYLPLPSYTLPPFYLYSGIPLGSMLFPNPFVVFFYVFPSGETGGYRHLRFFIWFFVSGLIFEDKEWSELNSLLRYYASPPISKVPYTPGIYILPSQCTYETS